MGLLLVAGEATLREVVARGQWGDLVSGHRLQPREVTSCGVVACGHARSIANDCVRRPRMWGSLLVANDRTGLSSVVAQGDLVHRVVTHDNWGYLGLARGDLAVAWGDARHVHGCELYHEHIGRKIRLPLLWEGRKKSCFLSDLGWRKNIKKWSADGLLNQSAY